MQKKKSFFAVLIVLSVCLFCLGCSSEPKIDTSSDKTFEESLKKVYASAEVKEQAQFGEYLEIVLLGKASLRKKDIKIDEFVQMYSMVKAFGNDADKKTLEAINGKTAKEIIGIGKSVKKEKLEQALLEMKSKLVELEKRLAEQKTIAEEKNKVEIICTGVRATQWLNWEDKPFPAIGSLIADITIKNKSSVSVRNVKGWANFYDDAAGNHPLHTISLGYLKKTGETGEPRDDDDKNLAIAPNAEWKGELVAKFGSMSPHTYPYPTDKTFSVTFASPEVILEDLKSRDNFSVQLDEGSREELKKSIADIENQLPLL